MEFWFNSGSLDGDGLLEQLQQVVAHCEMIQAQAIGFDADAGGGNARLKKLLQGKANLPECGWWLPEDIICTVNPYDPSRFTYLLHCSTHNLKAMRGAMFGSWALGDKCQFLDEDGNEIGKGIIEECFEYNRQQELRNP